MKLKYIWILLIGLLFTRVVYANDIRNIDMDIYIDNNGDAYIKEKWTANLTSGTEGYKPYYNLGQSVIKDFKVTLNNQEYTTLPSWNVDATFNEKSYKAGINHLSNGVELCFGISKYGLNTYEMAYTITNFVVGLEDADMVYWTLIPYELSSKPENIHIKIYSDFRYEDDLDVWGYGNYGGTAYVYDGYIELNHEDSLDSDEYMTVLVKFPKDTFKTQVQLDKDFDYYYDLAEDGAQAYSERKSSFLEFISFIIGVLFDLLPFIIVIIICAKAGGNKYGTKKVKFNKGIKNVKNAQYFRDLPCNKNIFEAYWVACQFELVNNKNDFLGAILLKWLKNENVSNIKINEKKNAIKFNNNNNLSPLELELYDMMVEASKDGILEDNEFTKWCKRNYSQILKWFNNVIDEVTLTFVQKGLIKEENKHLRTVYLVDDKMQELGLQMAGLKKFLNDFSNIKDRYPIEVTLWEEYLMYAQIFGIAKKVAKEFKDLYPDVITDEYYDDIIFIHTISYNGVHAASLASERARSYSAGGGGFSSGGGGGGSFGGGGGGGGFR